MRSWPVPLKLLLVGFGASFLNTNTPSAMVFDPVWGLFVVKVSVPDPFLVKASSPLPFWTTPLYIVVALLPPTVRVFEPLVDVRMVPAPEIEPTVLD